MNVFGLREKAGEPGEISHRHRENMKSSTQKIQGLETKTQPFRCAVALLTTTPLCRQKGEFVGNILFIFLNKQVGKCPDKPKPLFIRNTQRKLFETISSSCSIGGSCTKLFLTILLAPTTLLQ